MTDTSGSTNRRGILSFLLGKIAVPDHPATCLNPNGREGFVIMEAGRDDLGRIRVRGTDTMWFGESAIIEFRTAPEPVALLTPLELAWVISTHADRAKADIDRGDNESAERRQARIRELRLSETKPAPAGEPAGEQIEDDPFTACDPEICSNPKTCEKFGCFEARRL